jgi:hypothetical protein
VDASFNVDAGTTTNSWPACCLKQPALSIMPTVRPQWEQWVYADLDGNGIGNGYSPAQAGSLTVNSSGDTTPPAAPTGLNVQAASPAGVELAWEAVLGDATLYGYEVLRAEASGGPYDVLGLVTNNSYSDTAVLEGTTYCYVVRSVDLSFYSFGSSNEVAAAG